MTKIPQVGTPERRGSGRWFVPSGTAGVGYIVEQMAAGYWRCTCPSYRWHRPKLPAGLCKHIRVVKKEVTTG